MPKSWEDNQIPRMRPKGVFSFRDQVAWATVTLDLSEWFDTSINTRNIISLEKHIKGWGEFRNDKHCDHFNEKTDEYLSIKIDRCDNELRFNYPGIKVIQKSFNEQHGKSTHSENYLRSIILLSILIGNTFKFAIIRPLYMYTWKDLQAIFLQSKFPSTDIVFLLVNTLNEHPRFYEEIYSVFDYSDLPYRKIGENSVDNEQSYKRVIEKYLNSNKDKFLQSKSLGPIEILDIDLDVFKRGE